MLELVLAQSWGSMVVNGVLWLLFLGASVLMILTVLIQKPQGGGLAGAFGSGAGSGQTAFGAKTGDMLTFMTVGVFVVWVALAVAMNFWLRPPAPQPAVMGAAPTDAPADAPVDAGLTPVPIPAPIPSGVPMPASGVTPGAPATGATPRDAIPLQANPDGSITFPAQRPPAQQAPQEPASPQGPAPSPESGPAQTSPPAQPQTPPPSDTPR